MLDLEGNLLIALWHKIATNCLTKHTKWKLSEFQSLNLEIELVFLKVLYLTSFGVLCSLQCFMH